MTHTLKTSEQLGIEIEETFKRIGEAKTEMEKAILRDNVHDLCMDQILADDREGAI